jgi:hypothetical protein
MTVIAHKEFPLKNPETHIDEPAILMFASLWRGRNSRGNSRQILRFGFFPKITSLLARDDTPDTFPASALDLLFPSHAVKPNPFRIHTITAVFCHASLYFPDLANNREPE